LEAWHLAGYDIIVHGVGSVTPVIPAIVVGRQPAGAAARHTVSDASITRHCGALFGHCHSISDLAPSAVPDDAKDCSPKLSSGRWMIFPQANSVRDERI